MVLIVTERALGAFIIKSYFEHGGNKSLSTKIIKILQQKLGQHLYEVDRQLI